MLDYLYYVVLYTWTSYTIHRRETISSMGRFSRPLVDQHTVRSPTKLKIDMTNGRGGICGVKRAMIATSAAKIDCASEALIGQEIMLLMLYGQ